MSIFKKAAGPFGTSDSAKPKIFSKPYTSQEKPSSTVSLKFLHFRARRVYSRNLRGLPIPSPPLVKQFSRRKKSQEQGAGKSPKIRFKVASRVRSSPPHLSHHL